MKIKEIAKKFKNWVSTVWNGANEKVKKGIPIAVDIVEAVKEFNDSKAANFLEFVVTAAIPGDADDAIVRKGRIFVREVFPKILVELKIIQSIAELTDDNEKLRAILNELKLSSVNGIIYKGVAAKALEYMADGVFSFDDSVNLVSYWYAEKQKAKENGTVAE